MRRVRWTADIIRPDGSDTDCYGEPCEAGSGYVVESGWWDPRWSTREVYDEPEGVRVDTYEPDDGDPVEWLANTLSEWLCGVENYDGGSTIYSADFGYEDYVTGVTVRPAAHPDGFTPDEITTAIGKARA